MKKPLRERSALIYVLVGLIPYSKPNLLLTYKPSQFFWELEKISRYKQSTLRAAYLRAEQQGLVKKHNRLPTITARGRRKVAPFIAQKLPGRGRLMIIFDIPENESAKRRRLRNMLKIWQVNRVQKSVWSTDKDYREELLELIQELDLDDHVELHESARLYPK